LVRKHQWVQSIANVEDNNNEDQEPFWAYGIVAGPEDRTLMRDDEDYM
jgi:hypothetical protein